MVSIQRPVMTNHRDRPQVWKPGQSGNPGGRPKRKLLTDALRRVLAIQTRRGTVTSTNAEKLMARLMEIAFKGDDRESLKAIELAFLYHEGRPQQTVEIQFQQALEDMATRSGAPRVWLDNKAREIAARYALQDGDSIGADYEPISSEPTQRGRVDSVKRSRGMS